MTPVVLDPVVVRPLTLEAVAEVRPTSLVPPVDLDRELVQVQPLAEVLPRWIPFTVNSLVWVPLAVTSTTWDLVFLVVWTWAIVGSA